MPNICPRCGAALPDVKDASCSRCQERCTPPLSATEEAIRKLKAAVGDQGGQSPSLTARNGIGKRLEFFRRVGTDTFEATVWVIFLGFPLVPLSTWVVRPLGIRSARIGKSVSITYEVDFIERRPTTALRVVWMYLQIVFHLAVTLAPPAFTVLAYVCYPSLLNWGGTAFLIPGVILLSILWGAGYSVFLEWQQKKHFPGAKLF